MQDILQGEFFWGVIIGLLLSLLSGYILAQFTVRTQQKTIKETILKFSLDIIRNIQAIINEMDTTRDRANAIHYDFLNLIDIEIQIYGRNREHIIHIPDEERTLVRKFMNDIAIKKVDISRNLEQFYRYNQLFDQAKIQGNNDQLLTYQEMANLHLKNAQSSADKLVLISQGANPLIDRLTKILSKF